MKNPLHFKKVNPMGVVVKNLEEGLASYSKGIGMGSKGAIQVILKEQFPIRSQGGTDLMEAL